MFKRKFKSFKTSKNLKNMYLLKSKAPQISNNVPTLYFSAVFKMHLRSQKMFLHFTFQLFSKCPNMTYLLCCTGALKKTAGCHSYFS